MFYLIAARGNEVTESVKVLDANSLEQDFSHPLPAGKKMPAEPPKNARQALKENVLVYCKFCVFAIIRNVSATYEMPAEP